MEKEPAAKSGNEFEQWLGKVSVLTLAAKSQILAAAAPETITGGTAEKGTQEQTGSTPARESGTIPAEERIESVPQRGYFMYKPRPGPQNPRLEAQEVAMKRDSTRTGMTG